MGDDTFWGVSATGWTAIMSLLTFGLLVVAVVAALYAASQVKIARDQSKENRKAQAEANRPYVIVSIETSQTGPPLFDLAVKNIGQRPAVNVSITLDPPPLAANERAGRELAYAKMLNEPVAMIAPGQEMRAFYDSHHERYGRDDLPTRHRVTLTYEDSSGHDYREPSVLDIAAMKGAAYTSVKTVHHIGKSLDKIEKTLKASSILRRKGTLEVDAAVERREEKQERLAERQAESMERHGRLRDRLLPNHNQGDDHEPSGTSSAENSTDAPEHVITGFSPIKRTFWRRLVDRVQALRKPPAIRR